jgi:hypothetical protein
MRLGHAIKCQLLRDGRHRVYCSLGLSVVADDEVVLADGAAALLMVLLFADDEVVLADGAAAC